jgi:hypothetical protein
MEIKTYRDLLGKLKQLSDEQLDQPVQVAHFEATLKPVEFCPALAIATVGELQLPFARSIVDNKFHADEVVIFCDWNPFAEDGASGYLQKPAKNVNTFPIMTPIYGSGGKTELKDQQNPAKLPSLLRYVMLTVKYRADEARKQDEQDEQEKENKSPRGS